MSSVTQLRPLTELERKMKRVAHVRDHPVSAHRRGLVVACVFTANAKHTRWTKWCAGRGWLNRR